MASPSILAVLMQDHQEVAKLLKQAVAATNSRKRTALYVKINDALLVHTAFEERNLYPLLAAKRATKGDALEAEEEHAVVKHLLKQIGSSDAADDRWKAKMTVLQESVRHHVKEEEQKGGLFDELKKVLDKAELAQLAEDYVAMK